MSDFAYATSVYTVAYHNVVTYGQIKAKQSYSTFYPVYTPPTSIHVLFISPN